MPSPSFLEMRSRNAIHILQAVRESPGMSRAELAKVCDLAKSTVSSIVDQLTEAIKSLAQERNVPEETVFTAVENAFAAAWRRDAHRLGDAAWQHC